MKYKFLLLTTLFLTFNLSSYKMEITSKYLRAQNLENVKLFHEGEDFFVEENGEITTVERVWIDKDVRGISVLQLSYLLGIIKRVEVEDKKYDLFIKDLTLEDFAKIESSKNIPIAKIEDLSEEEQSGIKSLFSPYSLLELSKTEKGEYVIHYKPLLKGGGPGGAAAGVYIGKWATYIVGHGFIAVTSIATAVATGNPAAAGAVAMQMEAALGAEIEAASNVVAMTCGIIGGVATGPA